VLLGSIEDQIADEDSMGSGLAGCEFWGFVSFIPRDSIPWSCILRTRRAGLGLLNGLSGLSLLSDHLGILCSLLFVGKTTSLCEEARGNYR